jgi:hypothetical protein
MEEDGGEGGEGEERERGDRRKRAGLPFGGALSPTKMSGRKLGKMTVSFNVCFTKSSPAVD